MKNFIWLFGENLGNTHNNNSYYMWDQTVERKDNIDKYLVLTKTKENITFYKSLNNKKKQKIIWKNSFKHFLLFKNYDMSFVTLSYKDILPEKLLNINFKFVIKKPIIYLQHGTTAIKKLGYTGNSYYNNLFRFVYYNPLIKEQLIKENEMRDYQLYFGEYFPRYKELVRVHDEKNNKQRKKILFFITWREYFGENFETKRFINQLHKVFKNKELLDYVSKSNTEIVLCLHSFFDEEKTNDIRESLKNTNIKIVHPKDIDVLKELATCDLLITDYSSVGFDCTILGTPVLLYQPDFDVYFENREAYCDLNELKRYNIEDPNELVKKIISEDYKINDFFRSRLPKNIDKEYIKSGKHIERIYDYFSNLQKNRITILGYNFSGKGGTVTATKALAEALLEQDYLVELISLKITEKEYTLPYGLSSNAFINRKQKPIINKLKRLTALNPKYYYYFNYDINKSLLNPYIGKSLKKYLESTNSRTVISTRESIHLFLKKFGNKNIKNKLYFYHTDSKVLDNYYKGLLDVIKKERLENVAFVTETSKNAYKDDLGYSNYDNAIVIGNTLMSSGMSSLDEIKEMDYNINTIPKGIVLMRLSKDRITDVENIISFGKYLKDNNLNDIRIDIYGKGDLEDYLIKQILDNDLDDTFSFKGATDNSKECILTADCVVDFSNNQSFGMIYLEGILNGRPVYAKKNVGSLEVLKDIKDVYYESNEELYKKIKNSNKITLDERIENYEKINKRFSREASAKIIKDILK